MARAASDGADFLERPTPTFNDTYFLILCASLASYAVFGKSFAYLGIPPLFVGEIVLAAGLLALMRSGCWIAMLATPASRLLVACMVWAVIRTVPYLGIYGMDAPRDSVVVLYGAFCFIVVSLLLENPGRLDRSLRFYGRFARVYGPIGGALAVVTTAFQGPGSTLLISVRNGEAASHLAGVAVFALLGMGRFSKFWIALLLISMILVTSSRGAMLTCLLPVVAAAVLGRRFHRIAPVFLLGFSALLIGYLLDVTVQLPGEHRAIGPAQLVEGLGSLIGASESSNFEATKEFRLRWWATIQDYTFRGPYFWSGKGFGANLALEDGYKEWVTAEAALRSPHNVNMTILARAGVPGLALWLVLLGTWFVMLIRSMLLAHRSGEKRWADLFIWVACYGAAMFVDACFDVALEGPMLGIWFWCLFGYGIAASMIFRASLFPVTTQRPRLDSLDD